MCVPDIWYLDILHTDIQYRILYCSTQQRSDILYCMFIGCVGECTVWYVYLMCVRERMTYVHSNWCVWITCVYYNIIWCVHENIDTVLYLVCVCEYHTICMYRVLQYTVIIIVCEWHNKLWVLCVPDGFMNDIIWMHIWWMCEYHMGTRFSNWCVGNE